MAKNEAKIRFNAETAGFNEAIKKSNDTLGQLRAELKLNESQMKTTGASVDALENKQRILSDQLAESERKTEALSQKVNKAIEIYGENSAEVTKLRTQLLNAQRAEEQVRQAISACNDELDRQRSAENKVETETEKLTKTIDKQQTELKKLKNEYVDVVLEYGDTSDEAKRLANEIEDLSGELKKNKSALDDAADKADKLDKSFEDAGDAAEGAADGFTVAKGAIADLAADALQSAIGKVSEFIDYLKELPEATREIRQDMATLETSYSRAGFSAEQATETWRGLYGVFGEDDRAVEAANHIAKISDNQQDLNKWVTITKGVWGSYQDSLPVEGLAEAANETSKTGKVTGVLADALNWSSEAAAMFADYMSEDVTTAEDAFNEALKKCTTEEERQALITETLTALYGDAAVEYDKASGAQIAAKEATADNIMVQNELADAIEPVTTAWQGMKNEMLKGILPVVQKVSGFFQEHPGLLKAIGVGIMAVSTALGILAIAWGIYTVQQWLANAAMLACPLTWIVLAIAAVVAIIIVLVSYWDEISAAVSDCWESIKSTLSEWGEWINTNVIQPVKQFFSDLWQNIKDTACSLWDGVKSAWQSFTNWIDTNIIQPVIGFFESLWQGIKTVWDNICNAVQVAIMFIGSIIQAAWDIITLPFRFIWENCKEYVFAAWEWIKNTVSTAINAVKNTVTRVWNAVKNAFVTAWNACKNVVVGVWNAIVGFIMPIVNKIKSVITNAWNAIKNGVTNAVNAVKNTVTNVFNAVKTKVTSIFNSVKSTVLNIWNGIKNGISNAVNAVKNKVTSIFNSVKNTVSNIFNGIKNTATNVWNRIKEAITKPIEQAKEKISGIIDKIKGFFSNLKLKLPKIKLPHFKITGKLSLDPPSVPKLNIDWYKDGGIMMQPTIFGMNGSTLMAGGEAGPEAILPIDKLEGYIAGAIEKHMSVVNLDSLAAAIEDLASRPIELAINGRKFALATAGESDKVNGMRNRITGRGVILD